MNIQLIQGQFSAADSLDIITKMVGVKIKFHEDKIDSDSTEEDIKMREKRIKQLQEELSEIRTFIKSKDATIAMNSLIELN